MSHTRLFEQLRRIMRVGSLCDARGLSAREAYERIEEQKALSRREVLRGASALAGVAAAGGLVGGKAWALKGVGARIAVVGGGMAGLACMDRLQQKGVVGTLYEANSRVGGRIHSKRDHFPGQVAELGGELIDNLHKSMLAYANEFNLLKEDLGKAPGESSYHFFGSLHAEAEVVEEYRQLVERMRPDLQQLSGAPTFFAHTAADVALDNIDLGTYLATRAAGLPLIHRVLEQAYLAEYGLELSQQSCLNMLYFLHLDSSAKFREFGVFSDERYHVVEGNDAIPTRIRERLAGRVELGMQLTRLSKNASGELVLEFRNVGTPVVADAVVLCIPFSVLRQVTLDASLGLSADKTRAIQTLGYGANCKTMIGFNGRPWAQQGRSGLTYADLPNLQNTWESNYTRAGATSILTDYAGGSRGARLQAPPPPLGTTSSCGNCHNGPGGFMDLDDTVVQMQAGDFLGDLDKVYPGAMAAARRVDGKLVLARGHWSAQRYSRGSYTCYLPGQFTTVAGLEGQPAGPIKFAGEHADSFYEWQGFMEGAANSGFAAADALVRDIMAGRL